MDCKTCINALPDLLIDPASASAKKVQTHLASCPTCALELRELQATFSLLDLFSAPEPSAFFDQKLAVRLREAQTEAPAGWLETARSWLQLNTGRQFRPVLASALAAALIISGGTAIELNGGLTPAAPHAEASAIIQDLQILDKNDQAMQQMDQLLTDDQPTDSNGQPVS